MLVACGSTPTDETAGMSIEKLQSEARDEVEAGSFERWGIRVGDVLEVRRGAAAAPRGIVGTHRRPDLALAAAPPCARSIMEAV